MKIRPVGHAHIAHWMMTSSTVLLIASAGCSSNAPGADSDNVGNVADAIGLNDEAGLITSVGLSSTEGNYLGEYMTHHPVKVSMTILPTTPLADHHLMIGLVQKSASNIPEATARTCILGDFKAQYGVEPGEQAVPVVWSKEVVIPDDCLVEGTASGTYNLWVGLDPLLENDPNTNAEYNTQFFNAAGLDMNGDNRNASCVGPNGETRCVMDIVVSRTTGHDVLLSKATPDSNVGTIDSSCTVDGTRPLFAINSEVRIFGSAAHDGVTEGGEPANALVVAGGSGTTVNVSYALCPRGTAGADGTASCAVGTTYTPLKIGQGDLTELAEFATIDRLASGEPLALKHELFAAPNTEACGRLVGDTSAAENWTGYGTFNLKTCTDAPFNESKNGGNALVDNCIVTPVQIVAVNPSSNQAFFEYKKEFNRTYGGNVVNVTVAALTHTVVDASGAIIKNDAKADLGGWYSKNLAHVWANGAAYVSLVDSNVDAGIEIAGEKKWGYTAKIPEVHIAFAKTFETQKCLSHTYGLNGIASATVTGCIQGQAGIKNGTIDVVSKNGNAGPPFAAATRIGQATVHVVPFAALNLTLSGTVNAAVVRGGVTASLTLINASLPSTGDVKWGLLENPGRLVVAANLNSSLVLNTLSGTVRAWADVLKPGWCSWHPCGKWQNVWHADLASWPGMTFTFPMLQESKEWTFAL